MNKKRVNKKIICGVAILLIVGGVMFAHTNTASANIFTTFTKSIMDFFNGGDEQVEEAGVTSQKEEIKSKPDLMVEMTERIIDSQNIYLLISITAPTDIEFEEEISFDYFGFCVGDNYNADQLIGGARNCTLLEVMPGQPNKAIYVATLSSDDDLKEGSNITFFMKDLTQNPNGDAPELLVEGMWSITFPVEFTAKENIVIKGTEEMKFPFVNKEAIVEKVKITSLGMTITADVSQVPYDELGISDTTVAVRLKMIDGSEVLIMSRDPEDTWAVRSASNSYSEKKGKTYQKSKYEFEDTLDTSKVLGVYIEDLYIPVKEYETE